MIITITNRAPRLTISTTRSTIAPRIRSVTLSRAGVQGPAGPAGSSSSTYIHTQGSAATVWTIAHNLGFKPTVTAMTAGGMEMAGEVQHLSVNTLTITFTLAVSGTARLT